MRFSVFFPGKRLLARIVLAPVATVALVGAVVACSSDSESDAGSLSKGSCVEVTDNAVDAMRATIGDCGAATSNYRIVQAGSAPLDCAAEDTTFNGTVGDTETALCLSPNFAQGNCYADAGQRPAETVPCTAPEASFKVVKRIDGTIDELQCDSGATMYRTVADPKTTFCMARP
ncbi:LppU/SCO3897 family protein [Nocardia rhizosphaerae]|uniref:Pyridine nucleotide-disulfide oxidoreductase n=1 Tax=Nocardia rhizosphaerae TaxID=1691571 RepID=A0ABV8L2R9_9NOCA